MRKTASYTKSRGEKFSRIEESEQRTLGVILLYPERLLEVKAILQPKDFRYEKHRLIYRAMLNMEKQNIPIDAYTLWCFLRECGQLDCVGRASYLTYLCEIGWRC